MVNPIVEVREKLGISRIELARKLGVSYDGIVQLELGYRGRLSDKMQRQLEALGFSGSEISRQYSEWRKLAV